MIIAAGTSVFINQMNKVLDKESLIIGTDIGGTHITCALVDLANDCAVHGSRVRMLVNPNDSADEILEIWVAAIKKVIDQSPIFSGKIGIAMPGPFDYAEGISLIKGMHKYESLYGLNIRNILSQRLDLRPENIIFRNDAEAFLHGEVFCGAAKGYSNAFGVTLGTGLGSALSVERVTTDANLAISPLYSGIAEDYISTRWFLKRYQELTGENIRDVKSLTSLTNQAIALKIFSEFSVNLACFLNGLTWEVKPEIIVIGGNITKAHGFFWSEFKLALDENLRDVVFSKTKLWEDAALVGAACCFWEANLVSVFSRNVGN